MNAATLREHIGQIDAEIREVGLELRRLLTQRRGLVGATACVRCGAELAGDIRKRYCGAVCRSRQQQQNQRARRASPETTDRGAVGENTDG